MESSIAAIVGAIVGAFGGYVAAIRLHKRTRPQQKLKVSKRTFQGVPSDGDYLFGEIKCELDDSHLNKCLAAAFQITAFGNEVIRNLRINASSSGEGRLVAFHYWVDQQVICERLTVHESPPDELKSEWNYINPEDVLNLHLLFLGTENPDDVILEIDAEGLELEWIESSQHCVIPETGI